jgi:hypothetical protein
MIRMTEMENPKKRLKMDYETITIENIEFSEHQGPLSVSGCEQ